MKRSSSQIIDNPAKVANTRNAGHGPALMWFSNDLRIHDNPALSEACEFAGERGGLHALFLVNLSVWRKNNWSPAKIDFVLRTLHTLRRSLMEYNIPLQTIEMQKDEDHVDKVSAFCKERGIKSVYWNAEYELDAAKRQQQVSEHLVNRLEIPCCIFHDQCIVQPGELRTKSGNNPFTVFTPFKKAWIAYLEGNPVPISDPIIQQREVERHKESEELPVLKDLDVLLEDLPPDLDKEWPAGEDEAIQRLQRFVSNSIEGYQENRDFPSLSGTSRLSAYLSVGSISVRLCMQTAREAKCDSKGIDSWINELCWRDFYRHILFFFPKVSEGHPFKEITVNVPWRSVDSDPVAKQEFEAWCNGRTGYPLVDAAMRCLIQTGWMHNRLRMLTAMFLSKHLLIWWPLGETWFMQHLIDGDMASNNGGWQWSASTGTDSQPYFRIFNPVSQSERFDPDAVFIKRWIPELRGLSNEEAHFPFERIPRNSFIALDYPKPIVDHKAARARCLAAFKSIYK